MRHEENIRPLDSGYFGEGALTVRATLQRKPDPRQESYARSLLARTTRPTRTVDRQTIICMMIRYLIIIGALACVLPSRFRWRGSLPTA